MLRRTVLTLLLAAAILPAQEPDKKDTRTAAKKILDRETGINDKLQARVDSMTKELKSLTERVDDRRADVELASGRLERIRRLYAEGGEIPKAEVVIELRRLRELVKPDAHERRLDALAAERDGYRTYRSKIVMEQSEEGGKRFSDIDKEIRAAEGFAALELEWDEVGETRTDVKEEIQRTTDALFARIADLEALERRHYETLRRTLFLLRRQNLFLRADSRLTVESMREGAADLKKLPGWLGGAASAVGGYVADNVAGIGRTVGLYLAVLLGFFLVRRSLRVWQRRKDNIFSRAARRLFAWATLPALVFLAPWMAARLLPGLDPGVVRWLTHMAFVLGGFQLGMAFCKVAPSLEIPEASAKRLVLGVRLILLVSLVTLPVLFALRDFGYANQGVAELVELVYMAIVALLAMAILLKRRLVLSFAPGGDSAAAGFVRGALSILHPVLYVLVPAIVVLHALRYDLLAAILFRIAVAAVIASAATALILRVIRAALGVWLRRTYSPDTAPRRYNATRHALAFLATAATAFFGFALFLSLAGGSMTELQDLLDTPLPLLSHTTWWNLLVAGVLLFLFLAGTKHIKQLVHAVLLRNTKWDDGVKYTVTTLLGYALVTIGVYMAVTRVFDLSSLGTIMAALSVGIGFGLQEVISNFVSGLILLFERPLRVGGAPPCLRTQARCPGRWYRWDRCHVRALAPDPRQRGGRVSADTRRSRATARPPARRAPRASPSLHQGGR